jgi:hypothetical protein
MPRDQDPILPFVRRRPATWDLIAQEFYRICDPETLASFELRAATMRQNEPVRTEAVLPDKVLDDALVALQSLRASIFDRQQLGEDVVLLHQLYALQTEVVFGLLTQRRVDLARS